MSVEIKYKGQTIVSENSDISKTLKTSGKYCEDDITVINRADGAAVFSARWITLRAASVTVGANTVTNAVDAISYFKEAVGCLNGIVAVCMKTHKESYSNYEMLTAGSYMSSPYGVDYNYRWSYGINTFKYNNSYTTVLREGSEYTVLFVDSVITPS